MTIAKRVFQINIFLHYFFPSVIFHISSARLSRAVISSYNALARLRFYPARGGLIREKWPARSDSVGFKEETIKKKKTARKSGRRCTHVYVWIERWSVK